MEFLRNLIGPEFVLAYSGLVVLLAVGLWIRFFLKVKGLRADLRSATGYILGRTTDSTSPEEVRENLAQRWETALENVRKVRGLRHAWLEFSECLLVPSPSEREGGATIRNTRDPAIYFTRDTVVSPRVNLRFYDSVPGMLTGFGILGTFIGLAAGIGLAQEGLGSNDPELITRALEDLLAGASLAFGTSIAGLVTSIAFVVVERAGVASLGRALVEWNHALDRALERTTPEKVAVLQLEEALKQTEHLATYNKAAVSQLEEARKQSAELATFNTELAVSIATALDEKVAGRLGPALDRIVAATESLNQQHVTTAEDVLERVVEQFGATMTSAAGQEFEAIAESLRGLDGMLKDSMEAMREQEQRSAEAIQKLAGNVASTLNHGSVEMRKAFDETLQQMMASTESTISNVAQRFELMTDSAAQAARENSEALGREIGSAIGRAGSELDGVTTKMAGRLADAGGAAASRISESAESLADRVDGLAQSLDEARSLTEKLGRASSEVSGAARSVGEVLDGLKSVTPALRSSSTSITAAATAINEASETIATFGGAATEAAGTLTGATKTLEDTWARYVERFEGSDEALANVVQEMEAGLDSFTRKVTEFNKQVDSEFSRAISMLTSAIQELDQTLDERVA